MTPFSSREGPEQDAATEGDRQNGTGVLAILAAQVHRSLGALFELLNVAI